MRIIFIPGFGEEPWIFDKLHPQLQGEKVFVDHWRLLGDQPQPALSPHVYAKKIIDRYNITRYDLVIGHSMGGWLALHIKHLRHCPIVQIASWTDERKIARKLWGKTLVYWWVRQGLVFNPLVHRCLLWMNYRNKASAAVFSSIFKKLIRGNRECVANQLRLVYARRQAAPGVEPDLRIHACADPVILFPDQAACEVPGDHFTLWTHPETVYQPLVAFMANAVKANRLSEKPA